MEWLENLNLSVLRYLDNLKDEKFEFVYKPIFSSQLEETKNLSLGFSCYALKILVLLDQIKYLDTNYIKNWTNFIISFQVKNKNFPTNSFIDKEYIKIFNYQNLENNLNKNIKKISNTILKTNYKTNSIKLENYIRSETKQSISTLYEVDISLNDKFIDFPTDEKKLYKYLSNLNWKYPWSSGAQLAAISVFSKTQLETKDYLINKSILKNFIDNLVDNNSGFYFAQNQKSFVREKINGTMKIITALDWLDIEVHYPKKLIDSCLKLNPSDEGCDLVDLVYVLFKCNKITDYKEQEIQEYFLKLLPIIKSHYKESEGGFSYYSTKCQKNYYDVAFTKGKNIADIHGTLLLVWAIVMILDTLKINYFEYKVIKP